VGVESTVRGLLLADAAVAALVGSRIYPQYIAEDAAYPAIVYQKISVARQPNLFTPTDLVSSRIQCDVWDNSYSKSQNLFNLVRQALNGYRGIFSGFEIKSCVLDSQRDLYDPVLKTHRVSGDFIIFHDEVV